MTSATSVVKTVSAQRTTRGIVREQEVTSTHTGRSVIHTEAWLDHDTVRLRIGNPGALTWRAESHEDGFDPDEAEHLATVLNDLAKQARAVRDRKPWTGGPLP